LSRTGKGTSVKEDLLARILREGKTMYLNISLDISFASSFVRRGQLQVVILAYKYKPPAIASSIHTSIKISLYFFGFTPTLRSKSNVDLGEFFNKQGCIG
jgi:hypothetical protein